MLADTISSISGDVADPSAGQGADSATLRAIGEELRLDRIPTSRPSERTELDPREPGMAPRMRWVEVDYGGVRFLVGSYRRLSGWAGNDRQDDGPTT